MKHKIHDLKIDPEQFNAALFEDKDFEIRENDRDYQVGDIVLLREYNCQEYTGDYLLGEITYTTTYQQKDGYIVFKYETLHTHSPVTLPKKHPLSLND